MKRTSTLSLISLFLLSSCSVDKQGLYNNFNKSVFACDKQAVQYREACLEQKNKEQSYDEYKTHHKQLQN